MRAVRDGGHEIGLHGSFRTSEDHPLFVAAARAAARHRRRRSGRRAPALSPHATRDDAARDARRRLRLRFHLRLRRSERLPARRRRRDPALGRRASGARRHRRGAVHLDGSRPQQVSARRDAGRVDRRCPRARRSLPGRRRTVGRHLASQPRPRARLSRRTRGLRATRERARVAWCVRRAARRARRLAARASRAARRRGERRRSRAARVAAPMRPASSCATATATWTTSLVRG